MTQPTADSVAAAKAEYESLAKVAKRGFDPRARLQKRGLRKGTITLFLDEDKGLELGWAYDARDQFGNYILDQQTGARIRVRDGVEGDLDAAKELRRITEEKHAELVAANSVLAPKEQQNIPDIDETLADLDKRIEELTAKRDALVEELRSTALTLKLRAVPPIIQKDTHRKAKATLDIKGKVPDDEDIRERFNDVKLAHLMTVTVQEMFDHESGETNDGVTLDDALDLIGYLPEGQFRRLDNALGRVQFADTISSAIENQEDFS